MYLPFLTGKYSVAPALNFLKKQAETIDRIVFDIDEHYSKYYENKQQCRKENIHKYFCQHQFTASTAATINQYLVKQIITEHADKFVYSITNNQHTLFNKLTNETLFWKDGFVEIDNKNYVSLFDALCCQLQEDFAVCQLNNNDDYMAAIHLCSPNHWSPKSKVGKRFSYVHAVVPGMEKTNENYFKMLQTIVDKEEIFTRFAWGISTDDRLNHHPETPTNIDEKAWQGRSIENKQTSLFVRVERQNLKGFKNINAFLFSIRTYFYNVQSLNAYEKEKLWQAVDSMSNESLIYKGLQGKKEIIKSILL